MISYTLRIILGIGVIFYFIIVLMLLKEKKLTLKYTLLWLLAGLCMGLLVLFPLSIRYITNFLGIASEMNGLFAICLAFIICILMALTSIVSTQNAKIRRLTQSIAILENTLNKEKGDKDENN